MGRSRHAMFVLLLVVLPLTPALADEAIELRPRTIDGSCVPSTTVLCLGAGRFYVEIDWMDFDTNTGLGQVLPLGLEDSGAFWFSDPELPEIYVSVLDGTAINGFFWVFFGSLTNWEFTVTVIDTETNEQAIYFNPLGTLASMTDTAALPGSPPGAAARYPQSRTDGPSAAVEIDGMDACQPDATTLCLDGGRFRITVDWEDFSGVMDTSLAVPLTDQSGYFPFFSTGFPDLMIKLFDGGDGNFWFFFGATADLMYTISVTDVCSGATQQYVNPLGVGPTSFGDTNAFPATPTCLAIFADGFESGSTSAWSARLPQP
ncbi:MAG: hypothetical protein AAF657_11180 [Acidobacteriota bacterium]